MAILKVPVVIDGVKSIEELANRVLNEYEYKGRTIREWADRIANPKTKADRIRTMTDEELAEMMAHGNCGYCEIHDYCFSQKGVDCDEAWLDWLKQETEEGE